MAGQELASLVLSVDTRPMDAATVSMDKATLAAERLNAATDRLAKAGAAASGSRSTKIVDDERKIEEALGREILAIQRNTAAYERMQTQAARTALAGIRSPQAVADELRALAAARDMWEQAGRSAQGYAGAIAQINARTNVLTAGNARARGAIRETAAAMASLAFEAAGAAFLITAVGGALAAPAFFGTSMLKRVEDAQTGIAGILMSMGTLNGKALTFEQSMAASGEYVKKIQEDSLKFGIEMGRLVEVNQAAISGGLAAMLTLDQIQKVATAGAIAVSSLGLNSQQYVQEVRDLISGGIQPASSTLARSIGVTDALLKQWKAEGPAKLVGELTTRLEGFVLVADKVRASTLTGAWDILQARLALLMSDTEGFGALKKVVIDVANYIGTVDPISNKFMLNPQLVDTVRSYWDILKSVGATLVEIGKAFAAMAPAIQVAASALASVSKYLTEIVVVSSTLAGVRWFAGLVTSATSASVSLGALTAAMRAFVVSNPILTATAAIVAGIAAITEGFDSATKSMKSFEQAAKGMALNELYVQRQKLQTQLALEEKSWMRNGALVSRYRQEISLLTREINRTEAGKPTGGTSILGTITGTPQVDEEAAKKAQADADRAAKKARAEAIKANTDYVESQIKVGKAIDRESESLKKKIEQDKFEIASIGKTKAEIALLESTRYDHTTTLMKEQLAILDSTNACTAESEALRENIKLREQYKKVQIDKSAAIATQKRIDEERKANEDMWKSIESVAHDTWTRVFTEGRDAFTNIGKTIKSAILDMLYQMTVKKWIIGVSATGASGGASASDMGGGGGGFNIPGLDFGGSAITSLGNAIGSSVVSGLGTGMSIGWSAAAEAASAYSAAGMAVEGFALQLGAAMPYIGAALAVYSLLSGDKGVPTSSTSDVTQQYLGATRTSQSVGRYGGTGGAGTLDQLAANIAQITTALGGTAGAQQLSFGSNTGGRGNNYTPQFQIAGAGYVSAAQNMTQEAVATESARIMVSALQRSDLPKYLKDFFNTLVPSQMSQQDVSAALDFAKALKDIRTAAAETRTPLEVATTEMLRMGGVLGSSADSMTAYNKDLVDAIDRGLTPQTLAQWQQFGTLIQQVTSLEEQRIAAENKAAQASIDALKARAVQDAKNLRDAVSGMRSFADSIRELQGSLWVGSSSPLTTSATLPLLREQFSSALAGGVGTQGQLPGAATAYLDAARSQAASMEDYARSFAFVQNSLGDAADSSDAQATAAEQQLDELKRVNEWLSAIDEKSATQNQSLDYLLSAAIASSEAARTAVVDKSISDLSADIKTAVGAGFDPTLLSTKRTGEGGAMLSYAGAYSTVSGSVSAGGAISDLTTTVSATQEAAAAAKARKDMLDAQRSDAQAMVDAARSAVPPTTYLSGQTSDMLWESLLGRFNAAHMAAYGIPMNRPWGSDAGSQSAYASLTEQYRAAQVAQAQAVYDAIPAFETGGFHTGGLRLVGENGPELEYTGPSRIFNNGDTKSMLSNADVVAAINQLRDELRAGQVAISGGVQKAAKILDRWDGNGMPDLREAA